MNSFPMMKAFTLLVLLCSFFVSQAQQTWHVYSTEIPWSNTPITEDPTSLYSITDAIKAATAGDEIVIHEGIYRETVVVTKNNLTFRNFEDDYVLVSGAEVVTGWADASGMPTGVKVADVAQLNFQTDYSQLFSNGEMQQMGRHPNNTSGRMMEVISEDGGYSLLSNCNKPAGGNGSVTFAETTLPNVNLNGGIVRAMTGKMRQYVYGDIVSKSGNTVTFKAINNNTDWKKDAAIKNSRFKFSWGYVFHKNLVDTPGEWFIDDNKLYYFPREGEDVEDSRIEVQVRQRVLVLNDRKGITIQGLHFTAGNVDMQRTNDAVIEDGSFRFLYPFWTPNGYGQGDTDKRGIYLQNSSRNTFRNLYVGHSWGNMIALHDGRDNTFDNCIIEDFGWVGVFTSGIHINEADNTNITHCTFAESGRFQVRIDGGDAKVNILDCDFYGSMKMGEDAGPLEATSTGRIESLDLKGGVIAYNKVHDVTGLPVSDNFYNKQKIVAFYMEDTENYTAHHNLVYNFKADNYTGPVSIDRVGEFLYLGPRYNRMQEPVNYYNNTIWNYDELLSIWSIRINNWQALGIPESDNIGSLEDGHFANNIFMNGSTYRFNQVNANMSSKGQLQGYVNHPNNEKIETTNFDLYIERTLANNYHFNPENNVFLNLNNQANLFADAPNGDFHLKVGSPAIDGGIPLPGITSSATPDCGALEGGDRVLHAGASLDIPVFRELEQAVTGDEVVAFANFDETVEQNQSYTFELNYSAGAERHLVVGVSAPDGTWLANGKEIVQAGEGTMMVTVNLPSLPMPGKDYRIVASIRPVGGNAGSNLDAEEDRMEVLGTITGMDEGLDRKRLVYPNPTTGELKFSQVLDYEIYSIQGERLLKGTGTRVLLQDLARGSYIFRSGAQVERFILH